ncbi:hypothetical protein [Shewanella phage FishSpeaker]|nr:hypothetical protein [Shewanella phage FishSpeaker]
MGTVGSLLFSIVIGLVTTASLSGKQCLCWKNYMEKNNGYFLSLVVCV